MSSEKPSTTDFDQRVAYFLERVKSANYESREAIFRYLELEPAVHAAVLREYQRYTAINLYNTLNAPPRVRGKRANAVMIDEFSDFPDNKSIELPMPGTYTTRYTWSWRTGTLERHYTYQTADGQRSGGGVQTVLCLWGWRASPHPEIEAATKTQLAEPAIVLTPREPEHVVHVTRLLSSKERDIAVGLLKWVDRIVQRKAELPPAFFDNTDPTPLAKTAREWLNMAAHGVLPVADEESARDTLLVLQRLMHEAGYPAVEPNFDPGSGEENYRVLVPVLPEVQLKKLLEAHRRYANLCAFGDQMVVEIRAQRSGVSPQLESLIATWVEKRKS